MSPDTLDSTARHLCTECGRSINYAFGEGETPPPDVMCVLCMIQSFCKGECGIPLDDMLLMDIRLLTRVWMVLEMIHGLVESMDVTSEVYEAGCQPTSGLDVDLSEHHLSTGTLETLKTAGAELMTVFRRLASSLAVTREQHPTEVWFAINHHPAGSIVVEEWERVG